LFHRLFRGVSSGAFGGVFSGVLMTCASDAAGPRRVCAQLQ
jgi:hypothetical protein